MLQFCQKLCYQNLPRPSWGSRTNNGYAISTEDKNRLRYLQNNVRHLLIIWQNAFRFCPCGIRILFSICCSKYKHYSYLTENKFLGFSSSTCVPIVNAIVYQKTPLYHRQGAQVQNVGGSCIRPSTRCHIV